jgi:hypothetical protein
MKECYLKVGHVPYLFDVENGKVFEMNGEHWYEVLNAEDIQTIRFQSVEISRTQALELLQKSR